MRRRFALGTFSFDLPSSEEREAIWRIYRQKWDLEGELPKDEGWTGAEIKECCRKAWRLNLSIAHSAQYIVPVAGPQRTRSSGYANKLQGDFSTLRSREFTNSDGTWRPLPASGCSAK
jgi:SpoVK/Ycf46/Vps4 family AAA+-type ATPase